MLFGKLEKNSENLTKASAGIRSGLSSIFVGKKLDEEMLEELEELLIGADIGVGVTGSIIKNLRGNRYSKNITVDDLKTAIFNQLDETLKQGEAEFNFKKTPYVMLFMGVNGSGKTTVIGKIAHKFSKENKKVLIAACDTFRAGATEQLAFWAKSGGCDIIVKQKENEEPAALARRACERAKAENYDFLLIDTAGRLQNSVDLMNELSKIGRVLKKMDDSLPSQSILVLDAGIGQNSLRQFEGFTRAVNVDSFILNKIDGSAKGGILVSLIERFKKPVFAMGIGEKIDDIRDFSSKEFLINLLGL
jgi:fused signal recognition particle receptor